MELAPWGWRDGRETVNISARFAHLGVEFDDSPLTSSPRIPKRAENTMAKASGSGCHETWGVWEKQRLAGGDGPAARGGDRISGWPAGKVRRGVAGTG
jgi:hypothetical protein